MEASGASEASEISISSERARLAKLVPLKCLYLKSLESSL